MHVALFFTQARLRRSPSRRILRPTFHSISAPTPPRQTFAPPPGNHRFFPPFFSSTSESLFSQPLCFHIYRNPPIVSPTAHFHPGSFFFPPVHRSLNYVQLFCFQATANSWAIPRTSTPLQSAKYELFDKNTRGGGCQAHGTLQSRCSQCLCGKPSPLSTFNCRLSTSVVVNPLPLASNSTRCCCKEE